MALTQAERARNYRKRKAEDREAAKGAGSVTASRGVTGRGEGEDKRAETSWSQETAHASVSSSPEDVPEERPAGWRAEWRSPKARARAHDEPLAQEPLPEIPALRDEMFRTLRAIAKTPGASAVARVQAAKAILEETAPKGPGVGASDDPGDLEGSLESAFGAPSGAHRADA